MRLRSRIWGVSAAPGLAVAMSASTSFHANAQEYIFGVSDELNLLVEFSSASPGTLKNAVSITGLAPGEHIRAIDDIDTTLYGLGSENHLYTLNTTTGAATRVGSAFSPVLNGVNFGLTASSAAGPLYVASDLGQNLGLTTAGVATALPNFSGAALDTIAYDHVNNTYLGVSAVTHDLYAIVPTTGAETLIGPTGVNFLDRIGLSVSPESATAYFSATVAGSEQAGFYDINPYTGALTFIGDIGTPGEFTTGLDSIAVEEISIIPEPATETLLAIGSVLTLILLRRKS